MTQVFDGTNTRLRFGIAHCLEFLVDVPTYFDALSGHGDTGFTKTEVAGIVKPLFTAGALIGAVVGGVLMVRLGLLRSMLIFGVSQAVTNLMYCALAIIGKNYSLMIAAVLIR